MPKTIVRLLVILISFLYYIRAKSINKFKKINFVKTNKNNTFKKERKTPFRCGHGLYPHPQIKSNRIYDDLTKEEFLEKYKDLPWSPIRIHVDLSKLDSQSSIYGEKVDTLKNIISKSVEVLNKLINVKPLIRKIIPGEESKRLANFSKDILTKGIEVDLLIMVEFVENLNSTTIAQGYPLEYEEISGRPIIGKIDYNKLFPVKKNSIENGISTFLHEIMHVMLFNMYFYDKFVNSETLNKIPKNKIIKREEINGMVRMMIISPKVVETARKYFDCPNLVGIELENQGGDGTEFSHWEERLMYGEIMTGEDGAENVFSEMTLAFFDDSGWYKVNPFTGALFNHGLRKGCEFLNKKCVSDGVTKFKNEFCVTDQDLNCEASHKQRTICGLKSFDKIEKEYQYFSDPKLGGSIPLSDFCPLPVKNPNEQDELANSCMFGQKLEMKEIAEFETIGPDSACFVTNFYDKTEKNYDFNRGKSFVSACYQFKCNENEGIIEVILGGKEFKCPREGGPIQIEIGNANGTVHCMDFNLMCSQTVKCAGVYECAMKESKRKEFSFNYISKAIGSGSNL